MRLKVHLINPFNVPHTLVDEALLLELIQNTSAVVSGLAFILNVTYGQNVKATVADDSVIIDGVDEQMEARLSKLGLVCEIL